MKGRFVVRDIEMPNVRRVSASRNIIRKTVRHRNVFGGISLCKSPEESLVTALRTEIKDLKNGNNSVEAVTEFIRDTIANINGIYHVVSIDPGLMHVRNPDSNK